MTTTPRGVLTAYCSAIDDLDVEALLALYEPDIHPFDAFAWRCADWAGQVQVWLGSMRSAEGTLVEDVEVIEGAELAGLSALVRYAGTDQDGESHRIWNRLTWLLRRTDSGWRIAQEHTSVPLRMQDGQPDLHEATRGKVVRSSWRLSGVTTRVS